MADNLREGWIHSVSKENGLSGETVSQIITGPDGQIWLATNDGVCRYNGREITAFAMPRQGYEPNYTHALTFAPDRSLYAATDEGLFRLKRGSSTFQRVYPMLDKVETLLAVGETLYAGNRQGFQVLRDGKIRTITVGATPMGIENSVRDICLGPDKGVWFVSRYGLHRYDIKTGKVQSYDIAHLLPERTALSHLLPVAGHFFIGTKNNGLFLYDLHTKRVRRVEGVGNSVSYLAAAPGGKVALAAGGAFLLDAKTGKIIKSFSHSNRENEGQLPTDAVYCYYRDKQGVDWFGLYRYGMAYTYHSVDLFKTYRMGTFTTEGLDVRSILVNGFQKVIGTNDDLWLIDERRQLVRHYTSVQLGNAHALSSIAYFNGSYYVGTFDAGVHCFSAASFDKQPALKDPLLSTSTIGALTNDGRGHLWIGSSEGLFILDSRGSLQHYTENNSKIIGGQISTFCFMPDGTAWIGGPTGLCLYNPQAGTFEKDHFPNGFFATARIKEITPGHSGLFFFNTNSMIYYADHKIQKFGEIRAPRNMTLNGCVSFLDDLQGHYWVGTSDGLFCSDYKSNDILHFGYSDGLRCQLITGRLYKSSDGSIWVPTSNGLMSVKAANLNSWLRRRQSKMLLYHIQTDGTPVGIGVEDDANDYHRLNLRWNIVSQVMTLRPLLADFARPYGRLYEYRFDGHGEWKIVRDGEDLRLPDLFLGRHNLEIRLAGVPGTMTRYTITVSPSGWAIIELLLLIAAITAFVLWLRYKKNTTRLLAERNDINI